MSFTRITRGVRGRRRCREFAGRYGHSDLTAQRHDVHQRPFDDALQPVVGQDRLRVGDARPQVQHAQTVHIAAFDGGAEVADQHGQAARAGASVGAATAGGPAARHPRGGVQRFTGRSVNTLLPLRSTQRLTCAVAVGGSSQAARPNAGAATSARVCGRVGMGGVCVLRGMAGVTFWRAGRRCGR